MTSRRAALALALAAAAALGGLVWLLAGGPALRPGPPGAGAGPTAGENSSVSHIHIPNNKSGVYLNFPEVPGRRPPVEPAAGAGLAPGAARATGSPSLSGRVVDAETRAPLARARVASRLTGGGPVRGVETDAEGRFAFRGLPAGTYEVMATAEGYLLRAPAVLATGPTGTAEIALARGLVVRGRVVDDVTGRPVTAGARIELRGAPEDRYAGPFAPLASDGAGRFELRGVPEGDAFVLAARAPGFSETETPLGPVRAPGGLEGVEVRLRRLGLRVTVSMPDGRPAIGGTGGAAEAAAEGVRFELQGEAAPEAMEEAAGRFLVAVPRAGAHTLRARRGGLLSRWLPVPVPADGPPPEALLRLEALAAIAGRVVGADGRALPSAEVSVVAPGEDARRTLTDEGGRFRVEVLGAPEHTILARCAGFVPATRVLRAGEPIEIVLRASEGAVPVRGEFRGPGGKSMLGTVVSFEDAAGGPAPPPLEVRVGRDGKLEVGALEPGTYTVSFPERADNELRAWVLELGVESGKAAEVDFEAPEARGVVRGLVRGLPQGAFVNVRIRPAEPPRRSFGFMAATGIDERGAFAFAEVPAGRYVVRAESEAGVAEEAIEVGAGREARADLDISGGGEEER